jgi:hypothetical protein
MGLFLFLFFFLSFFLFFFGILFSYLSLLTNHNNRCDKKCFASALDCIPKGGGGGDTAIIPVDIVVQTGFTVDVLVLDQTGLSVGEVKVPPGAFPEGTVLTVGSFIGETPEEQEDKKCGGTEAGTKRVSGIFDIKAYEPNGKRAQPKKDIDISMVVQLPVSLSFSLSFFCYVCPPFFFLLPSNVLFFNQQSIKPEDLCFAFNQGNEGDEWGCQDSSNFRFKKLKNNTYEITNKVK